MLGRRALQIRHRGSEVARQITARVYVIHLAGGDASVLLICRPVFPRIAVAKVRGV